MKDWKEEFDKLTHSGINEYGFEEIPYWCCGGDFCDGEDHIKQKREIEQFISKLLVDQRQSFIELVESKIVEPISGLEGADLKDCEEYNRPLDELLKEIKRE